MKKRNNKKGFTLAELLIVVAIIGVLVAISFPIFAGKMEKARIATDKANIRAAKAAATATYMLNEGDENSDALKKVYFDAEKGVMTKAQPEGYGQTTKAATKEGAMFESANKGNVIEVIYPTKEGDDQITFKWVAGKGK